MSQIYCKYLNKNHVFMNYGSNKRSFLIFYYFSLFISNFKKEYYSCINQFQNPNTTAIISLQQGQFPALGHTRLVLPTIIHRRHRCSRPFLSLLDSCLDEFLSRRVISINCVPSAVVSNSNRHS